ncbi:hypothetical protein V5799_025927 [Amblyomma americanum]|uniref:Uncharacterized protein n=1 Tax=Amblyomma americanum TaxID=6943 RepID=A0AAQ4DK16_AMBAM
MLFYECLSTIPFTFIEPTIIVPTLVCSYCAEVGSNNLQFYKPFLNVYFLSSYPTPFYNARRISRGFK